MTSPRSKSARPGRLRIVSVATAAIVMASVGGFGPSASAQSIDSLRDRAKSIAAELDSLDQKTNDLDEAYNSAQLELSGLREKLQATKAEVDKSRAELTTNRSQAQAVAIQAFIGNNDRSADLGLGDDVATDSRRRAFLGTQFANSQDVIDSLVASQKDLADREAELSAANAKVDAKVQEIERSSASIEAAIRDRKALFESVSGELAAALQAEQERMAREAEAKAERQAREAAARAEAARRQRAVSVSVAAAPAGARAGSGLSVAAAPAAPRVITPPPANAPTAVQVAMAQQGDPYRWAASGPDSFDCSGLILFAYRAAGISLPHSSRALRSMSRPLSVDELQPGDLVFGGSPIHHVGLYIGNGQMVHAPHSGDVVKVSSIFKTSKPVSFGRL